MANHQKTYFLSPTWDYGPDGPIQLGRIVTSAKKVADPLNLRQSEKPDEEMLFKPHVKLGVHYQDTKERIGRLGLWTGFLSLFGIGVDAEVGGKRGNSEEYTFEKMETTEFAPSDVFLEKSMAATEVVDYIQRQCYNKHVFMVTAVKTVYGVTGKSCRERGIDGQANVTVDGTLSGVAPVSLGPSVGGATANRADHSFAASSDFVFAFKLRKVMVSPRSGITHTPVTKGTMYGTGSQAMPKPIPFTVDGLAPENDEAAIAEDVPVFQFVDEDDDAYVTCVSPFRIR